VHQRVGVIGGHWSGGSGLGLESVSVRRVGRIRGRQPVEQWCILLGSWLGLHTARRRVLGAHVNAAGALVWLLQIPGTRPGQAQAVAYTTNNNSFLLRMCSAAILLDPGWVVHI
jgi:hypothetical protein